MPVVDIHEEIASLRRLYTVDKIMLSSKQLRRASLKQTATPLHEHYDVVPCPYRGPIKGYFHKRDEAFHEVDRSDLIGSTTSLIDAIRLLGKRDFFFVLDGNEIAGFVHYSDLNHPHTRIPIFGMLQLLERKIWETISRQLNDDLVHQVLMDQWAQISRRRESNRRRNLDTGWSSILYLPELLTLGIHLGKIEMEPSEKSILVETRNKVMHPAKSLVATTSDLSTITEALNVVRKQLRDSGI